MSAAIQVPPFAKGGQRGDLKEGGLGGIRLLTEHIAIWTDADTEKKTGRGRSSGNAATVYGIRKLRELILELAVRGKLVPQDANDEPASALLKRIHAEKAKLIAEGKIKKDKPLSPITDDEKPFELPQGWEWVRLGMLGEWGAGATPARGNSKYFGGNIPWFKSGELTADYISQSEETVTELALKECSLRANSIGDVLIAMYGATIGKTAILSVPATTNQAVCACTPFSGIANRYLLLLLKALKPNFIGQGAGGAQPNISREKIIATITALPPLAEQHRIVAKVDELMALCDQLEARHNNAVEAHEKLVSHLLGTLTQSQKTASPLSKMGAGGDLDWQRIAAHFDTLFTTEASIDALKQALLQLAVMGKLVPQDPNDEPASALLKRIQAEKARLIAEGKIKKDNSLPPITEDEKPFDLPQGWEWVRLGDISQNVQYGYTASANHSDRNVLMMRITDIQEDWVNWLTVPGCDISEADFAGYALSEGDIVIARTGGTIGKSYLVSDLSYKAVFASYLIRVQKLESSLPPYTKVFLGSQLYWDQLVASSMGTGQPNVNGTALKSLVFPLPPLAEQHRIVAKVDELMVLCDQLKTRITLTNQLQQKLADVMVEQAIV